VYETALVVSFMRPFVGTLRLPTTYYTPPGPNQVQLFKDMKALRDKVYAHTDGALAVSLGRSRFRSRASWSISPGMRHPSTRSGGSRRTRMTAGTGRQGRA
jgi:hypothetical protein